MELIAFYVFAAIAVIASLLVVGVRSPMHSVMLLIVSFGALAGVTGFSSDEQAISSISSVSRIGSSLFTTHAFAFEVTSILILVSMVGAVVIARRAP
jgi:NADH:ubiquinone oxidoreductase subunit 6 (subunit J)